MTLGTKSVRLDDFLTKQEIARAAKMYLEREEGSYARRVAEEIITPVLGRINQKLGQENDALYLAYAIEFSMSRMLR